MNDSGLPLQEPGPSAAEQTDSKKEVRPLHVLWGFVLAGVLLLAGIPVLSPGLGFLVTGIPGLILLVGFLIVTFHEDRGMFVGGLIFVCLVLLLIASCFVQLSPIQFH